MSKKYHINPETGRPNICTATIRGCKYAIDGIIPEHYDSKESASIAFEKSMNEFVIPTSESSERKTPSRKRINIDDAIINEEQNLELIQNMHSEYSKMIENFDKFDKHAISFYSLTGSSMINRALHGVPREDEEYDDESRYSIKNFVERIDQIIENNEPKDKVRKLYRYVMVPKDVKTDDYVQTIIENGEYRDSGYMSTTEDLSFIAGYASKHRNQKFVLLEIETDRGISLQSADEESEGHLQSFEKERLLPRDMNFSVQGSGKTSIQVDESRETLRKQFAGWGWKDWASDTKVIYDIPKQSFSIIKLRDKSLTDDK